MSGSQGPNLEWLQEAQTRVNADRGFRKRGSIDVVVGVKGGDRAWLVTFAAFSCHGVREIAAHELRDASIVIDMKPDLWQRFIAGRKSGDGRTLVDLDATDGIVTSSNPRKKLDFFRYHTSLQAFFDAGAAA